jgi:hypothetical protein
MFQVASVIGMVRVPASARGHGSDPAGQCHATGRRSAQDYVRACLQ